jgi:hypothetical protein
LRKLLKLWLVVIYLSSTNIISMNANKQRVVILNRQEDPQFFFNMSHDDFTNINKIEMRNLEIGEARKILQFLAAHKAQLSSLRSLSIHACRIDANIMQQIEEVRADIPIELEYSSIWFQPQMADFMQKITRKDQVSLVQITTTENIGKILLEIATEFRFMHISSVFHGQIL